MRSCRPEDACVAFLLVDADWLFLLVVLDDDDDDDEVAAALVEEERAEESEREGREEDEDCPVELRCKVERLGAFAVARGSLLREEQRQRAVCKPSS